MKGSKASKQDDNILYLLAYVFTIVSGIIIYLFFAKGNKRLRMHSEQAIILGVIMIVLSAILFLVPYISSIITLLVWIYGLYIGFEAYSGRDVDIPYITEIVKRNGL
ncbi:MAG: hypothetical protein M1544_00970 [Candidatus Marsarchaeota archaeon]|nr:hypothetical protein [Candidatus Marsarchaeota archaeon]MCL5101917.1 hypothetical protein [Candidatus Marsarchaeota archaeon]